MGTETNILLPSARVDLFLRDKKTLEAARSLVDDWRFARVNINVEEGDVETAILSYEEATSPSLVLIETNTTDESFIDRLGKLSAHCEEDTNAIIIGPVNDVTLYRSLTSIGVSDYLVIPVAVETLSEVIAKALIDALGTSGSRLICVAGAKGGVGTSALSQAMAWGVSELLGQKTFLVDAAGGWSTASVGMGFEPTTTLQEAVKAADNNDMDTLKRMFYEANDKLTVLASGSDSMLDDSVKASQFETLIDLMMQSYPVVIVDLSAAIPSLKRTLLAKAHELIIVSTATLPSLRATRTLLQEIKLLHGGDLLNTNMIVNMAGMIPGKEVPNKDIAAALDFEPTVVVPFDPKLFVGSENEGKKISADKSGQEIVEKLMPMAQKVISGATLTKTPAPSDNIINQFMQKLGINPSKGKA